MLQEEARRGRVLGFDQHPITLAALAGRRYDRGVDAVVATGSDQGWSPIGWPSSTS